MLQFPLVFTSWHSHSCVVPFPHSLWSVDRMWQKWWYVNSEVRSQKPLWILSCSWTTWQEADYSLGLLQPRCLAELGQVCWFLHKGIIRQSHGLGVWSEFRYGLCSLLGCETREMPLKLGLPQGGGKDGWPKGGSVRKEEEGHLQGNLQFHHWALQSFQCPLCTRTFSCIITSHTNSVR